ncbi:Molybdopterin binding protein [Calocera viscosa TUFC12733]|uniref:Molybdopterin binding protein n=1 Tax=Calocera viscosa (strain TUFC12733) TaxID=1330018 RepID=A0A167KIB6_CALVF|nr:Molybdopterin binding protein [Calocera viscosa TUFC12733]
MSTTANVPIVEGAAPPQPEPAKVTFLRSPVPPNPLGEGKFIRTAGCLIIGDEILNGKTHDKNSNTFAKFCFDLGIEVKRIEVVPDEEEDIIEAARRMVSLYDCVITSGGIGPTHDDITYSSLAAAFGQELVYNDECIKRMTEFSKARYDFTKQSEEQKTARLRMALFPKGGEVLFCNEDLWVPVVRLEGKLCIFPGIPRLFNEMLMGLAPYLPLPPSSERPFRHLIHTGRPESSIAPFLTELANRTKPEGIRVGSYPDFRVGVTVSLIGKDQARLRVLQEEVVKALDGTVVAEGKVGEEEKK